jgi:hypothetical protein
MIIRIVTLMAVPQITYVQRAGKLRVGIPDRKGVRS